MRFGGDHLTWTSWVLEGFTHLLHRRGPQKRPVMAHSLCSGMGTHEIALIALHSKPGAVMFLDKHAHAEHHFIDLKEVVHSSDGQAWCRYHKTFCPICSCDSRADFLVASPPCAPYSRQRSHRSKGLTGKRQHIPKGSSSPFQRGLPNLFFSCRRRPALVFSGLPPLNCCCLRVAHV